MVEDYCYAFASFAGCIVVVIIPLLLADETNVTGAELIKRIFETAVRNKTALTECQLALTDGFTVTSGTAQSCLTVGIAVTT